MEMALSLLRNSAIDIFSGTRLSDLGYVDNLVLLSENPSKLQVFIDHLNDDV